ncbi:hypothetical protein M0811_05203 [Anaeramoeba ignava]|uniref:Uncharacterized protein n=1 Tax=Anaeramoeba ignava TaxID=1746090 RepID=A0A9Q0LQI3_ANAIG|nr:hypothetical protein M0811_05203 [Anaeramoeba ignava]
MSFTFLLTLFQYTNDFDLTKKQNKFIINEKRFFPEIEHINDLFEEYQNFILNIHYIIQDSNKYSKIKNEEIQKYISEQIFQEYDFFIIKHLENIQEKEQIKKKFDKIFKMDIQENEEQNKILNPDGYYYGYFVSFLNNQVEDLTRSFNWITDKLTNNRQIVDQQENIKNSVYKICRDIETINEDFEKVLLIIIETAEKYLMNKNIALPIFNDEMNNFPNNRNMICENILGINNYPEPNPIFTLSDIDFIIPTRIARIIHYSLLFLLLKNETNETNLNEKLIYHEIKSLSIILNLSITNTKIYYILFLKEIIKVQDNQIQFGRLSKQIDNWKEALYKIYKEKHENILSKIEISTFKKPFKATNLLLTNPISISNLISNFLKKPENIENNIKKYPLISFFIQNYLKFKMIYLFPSFIKFSSFINIKYNGKINLKQSQKINIEDLFKDSKEKEIEKLNEEEIKILENWEDDFNECWIISLSQINNDKINEVFQIFIETENILIIINNFQFKDKIILNTSFLDESKWKQINLSQDTWNEILIKHLLNLQKKTRFQFELENIKSIKKLKIQHLRFIHNDISQHFESIIDKIDNQYKNQIPTTFLNQLDSFFEKISITNLILIFQNFFSKELIQKNYSPEQELLNNLVNIGDLLNLKTESEIIRKHFPRHLTLKYSVSVYLLCLDKLKKN